VRARPATTTGQLRKERRMSNYKRGMKLKSKTSGSIITLTNRASGNLHWNTKKTGSKNNHKIHEGTLDKFYTELKGEKDECIEA
jgi:hypothetical protein